MTSKTEDPSTTVPAPPATPAAQPPTNGNGTRKRWLTIVVGAFVAIGVAYGA